MAVLGEVISRLAVSLSLETAAFEKGATLAEKRANQMQRKFAKLGDRIGNIGKTMSIGLTAPLAAFGVSAFNAASDAAELDSAFTQTFGNLSAEMRKWAVETGDAMGRSTQELQRAANTFGIFFNQAAPTREEAAKMSQTFTVLAQDLASFYNVSESDALQKLRSGLSGEAEPLRDFGVFLSAAAVEAKGLEMGLGGLSGELTEQEKIMARYQLILEGTTNAQGDVAKTSDGTANRVRELKASFAELQVAIGTKLLPALTPLIDKMAGLIDWFTQLPAPVQEGTLVVAGIAAAMGPLLIVVGQLTTAIPLLSKALLFLLAHPVILGAAAVIGGIYLAWKNWDKITAIVQEVYQGVKTWLFDKLNAVFDNVKRKIEMVEGAFRWLWDKVVGNSWVPDMVDGIASHMARLDAVMVQPAIAAVDKVNAAFAGVGGQAFAPGLGGADRLEAIGGNSEASGDGEQVQGAPGLISMAERWETVLRNVGSTFGGVAGQIATLIADVINPAVESSIGKFGQMQQAMQGITSLFQSIFGKKVGGILGGIVQIAGAVAGALGGGGGGFGGFRANGGPMTAGKSYMVGERGPELIVPRHNSHVVSNEALRGGGRQLQVEVIANNNGFGAIVRDHAGQVLAQAAPSLMNGAADIAAGRMAHGMSRRLTPGGLTG